VRAIVSGYYGFGNAGDEAVLAGIVAGMRRAAGDAEPQSAHRPQAAHQLTVISGDPPATARAHGVRAIGRFDVRALRRELDGAHLFISGGGNLFQDSTSARSCLYYLAVLDQALKADVPVMVLGQGIGPLRRRWLRALARHFLNRAHGIALRDTTSARELERIGVNRPPVRVGADLSFAMDMPDAQQVAQAWRDLDVRQDEQVLAVAPRAWRVHGGKSALARLASGIKQALARLNPPPRIVVFPLQRPRDDDACAALAHAVGGLLVQRELPPALLAGMIGAARAVVGMRLHALIFAAMGGAVPVAVSYDPKVEAFMADIGRATAATTADLDEGRLGAAIVDAWNAEDAARAALRRAADERRRTVADTFAWAVEIVRRN